MSFDNVIESACTQTITLIYIYLYVWGLDLRLNNIIYYQFLFFIICIDLNHHCHYYWTSKSLLNLWKCIQGSDTTNKWVVHFVISVLLTFLVSVSELKIMDPIYFHFFLFYFLIWNLKLELACHYMWLSHIGHMSHITKNIVKGSRTIMLYSMYYTYWS